MPIADFKALVREQFNILLIHQEAALAAIPSMSARNGAREKGYDLIKQLLSARGELSAEDKNGLSEVARLFGLEAGGTRRQLREVPKGRRQERPDFLNQHAKRRQSGSEK